MNVLIFIVVFLSLIVGRYLRRVAKDEMHIGEKYFNFLEKIFLLLISLTLLFFSSGNWWIVFTFVLGLFIAQIIRSRWLYLGLALVSSMFISAEVTIFMASLIFIYGLIKGTLPNNITNKLVFFLPLLLLLTKGFMIEYGFLISGFAAGALFLRE